MVTFHNQRDFIFVRHHRYIYKQEQDTHDANQSAKLAVKKGIASKKKSKNSVAEIKKQQQQKDEDEEEDEEDEDGQTATTRNDANIKTRARLQELGPRFTMKLKWLQEGIFNHEFGEYEWIQGNKQQMLASKRKFFL